MDSNQDQFNNTDGLEKVDQVENMMINTISETMDLYGVTPSVGRLYGILYFKQRPMTLDEMKDELGMSKPSMSTSIRKLQDINIVKKVWQKGTKKDLFVAEKNFFNYFSRFFGMKWERESIMYLESIQIAQKQLNEVIDNNDDDEALQARARQDYEQLENAKRYYKWMDKLTRLTKSGEIFNYIPIDDIDEDDS
ncbi:transcriptional regulator GbsR [Lentibacillus halophilus]|uniref:HTH-type transcriptional regulator n=1 Tax=Lentibacillus halophilus TaxID=295065 RepID=A0ABP3J1T8_9BACI